MNISIKILVTVVTIGLLGGCKVSKDVQLPKAAVPGHFRGAVTSDSLSIGDKAIADFFPEKELRVLIDTAIVRNYDMQIAIKNLESTAQLLKQAKLGNLPQLNLQVTGSSTNPSNNSLNGLSTSQFLKTSHIEDFNANLGLTWEADVWGKIKSQKHEALATYLQTDEARKTVQTQLIANVAQGYYRLLMMDAQMAIARKSLALSDSTLRMVKLQFDAGQVSFLAVQQAKAQQLVSAQLLPKLQQDIAVQENALSMLTGRLPGAVDRMNSLDQTVVSDRHSAGYPSAMVSKRPDVKSAELSLAIANARVGVTKANMYPSISITATGGLNTFKASNWFNMPASLFGMVAGGITQPLIQKRQLKTQYELAKIEREKAVIRFRQSVLNAVTEVSDELIKIEKLQEQYNLSKEKVNTLHLAVKNAGMLFSGGMATYLEILSAQSNSLQSELELTTIKTARLNAAVELYRALGGGL